MAYYKRRSYRRRGKYGYKKYRKSSFSRKKARQLKQSDKNRIIVSSAPVFCQKAFSKTNAPNESAYGKYTEVIFYNPILHLVGYKNTTTGKDDIPRLPAFAKFAEMFDEFKINAMRIKIQMISLPVNNNNTACIVRSAIDKNGVSPEFVAADVRKKTQIMQTYSSFNSKIINNSDLYSLYKTFYPVGPFQKGRWLGCSHTFTGEDAEQNTPEIDWTFKPIIMVQFYNNDSSETLSEVQYNIQYDFDVTFKGQRNIVE